MWRGKETKRRISTMVFTVLLVFGFISGCSNFLTESSNPDDPIIKGWLPIIEISSDIVDEDQGLPSIAVCNGEVHVVWLDRGDGDYDIFYRHFDGNIWQPEVELSTDAVMENQSFPSIAAEDGKVHVVWYDDCDGDGNGDICYRYFNGIDWQPEMELSTDDPKESHQSQPSIAVEDGKVHVVWEHGGYSDIHYRYFDGLSWQPEQNISTDSGFDYQHQPTIAVDGNDVHVTWTERKGGDRDIYYRHFNGAIWEPELEISTDVGTEDQWGSSIAVNAGKVDVTWTDKGDGDMDIFYRHFNGFIWQPEFELSTDNKTEGQYYSSMAVNDTKVHVVWTDNGEGDPDIYYKYLDGASIGPEQEISMDVGIEMQSQPSIAVDGEEVHVVWSDHGDGDDDIYYRHFVPVDLADLYLEDKDIVFKPPSPISNGTIVNINSTIRNKGIINASNVLVRFFDGDPAFGGIQIGIDTIITLIPAYNGVGWAEVSAWTATPVGVHNIYVSIDPENNITELNEMNNIANNKITVSNPDYIPWNMSSPFQKVYVGDSVQIASQVMNNGGVNATNESYIAFFNQSTPSSPFKTYKVLPLNGSAVSNEYQATWTAPMIAGTYYVIIEVDYYNEIDEINEANNTYEIEFNVTDKPVTTINLGTPQYGTTPRFVNSSTQFWFSVVDYSGTGYNTYYYIDNPPWIQYTGDFTVANEGSHTINYYSVDNLGGVEDAKAFEIIVDNTPPTTIIYVGDPKYISGDTWITSVTEFTTSSIDAGLIPVGDNYTEYRVWNGGSWTPWNIYTTGFSLGSSEGFSYVEFYSVDWLGNKELINNRTYIVDNTAPTTTIQVGTPIYINVDTWVTSNTGFILNAVDGGAVQVGLNFTEYRVWHGTWSTWNVYQNEFTLDPGDRIGYLEFQSVDLLGIVEIVSNETYIVDDTPPDTTITVGSPKFVSDNTLITSDAEFSFETLDGGLIPVGTDYTEYRIWNNGLWSTWVEYSNSFKLDVDDGMTYMEFYSVDYLGNREITNNETCYVDNTQPETIHILKLESDNTEARISLIPIDAGSGVNYTKYRVDSGDWATYSGTFIVNESGLHTIYFWSIDRLGNVEVEKNFSVLIEEPGIVVPPGDEEDEVNWKPLIALTFAIILLLIGTFISHKRPLKFIKNPNRKQIYTWMIVVLPLILAEITTGVISGLTGLLSVPPLLGPGMVVDLAILILGLLVFILIYKKFGE